MDRSGTFVHGSDDKKYWVEGVSMRKERLTDEIIDWAYEKWLDGYSISEIARAIGCSDTGLDDRFKKAGYTREKPPLRIPKGMKVREGDKDAAD